MLIVVKSFDHHVFLCLCLRASAQQKLAVYVLYIWDFKRLTTNYDWSCSPAGCLLLIPNYTGDRLNFGLAAERARGEGIRIATYVVGEDCALTTNDKSAGRRGLTGIPVSIKVAFIMAKLLIVRYSLIVVDLGSWWFMDTGVFAFHKWYVQNSKQGNTTASIQPAWSDVTVMGTSRHRL